MEAAIAAGTIGRVALTISQARFAEVLHTSGALDLGEREALAYGRDAGLTVIIEERKGRTVARAHGISYTILQVFPLYGYIEGKIAYTDCTGLLERIAVAMNTDMAILAALRAAAEGLQREREGERQWRQPSS